MIVVDASALVESLVRDEPDAGLVLRLSEEELHAPHLLDVEVCHALRGLSLRREIAAGRAAAAVQDFGQLGLTRYPHGPLRDRTWALRHTLSAYDATYIALAELLNIPLVTADRRLAGVPGTTAVIEVYGLPA